jgi:hypothetical protein
VKPPDDQPESSATDDGPIYVKVHDARPEGYDGTCLRPLGLCTLGGCCEACWYRPNHPRFAKPANG